MKLKAFANPITSLSVNGGTWISPGGGEGEERGKGCKTDIHLQVDSSFKLASSWESNVQEFELKS
jgi:hypothetical protein